MNKNNYDVIVIGGGPAGMMAAGRAGELGAKVLLIEKNDRLGKKLSITGGGRCNITNAEFNNRLFLDNFFKSKQFLFSSLSQFNSENTFKFFEDRGLPLKIEERKRAFPKTDKASDVCLVMSEYMTESGKVTVMLQTIFKSFVIVNQAIEGIETSAGIFKASKIVLATGGFAAPKTGSTGEGVSMLGKIGHTIKDPDPMLVPLKTSEKWTHNLSGTSIGDMSLRYIQDNKVKLKRRGRLLFTHFGISGPLVINSAFEAKNLLEKGPLMASVDLFPDYDHGQLDSFLLNLFEQHKKKLLKSVLKDLIPKKLSETILVRSDLQIGDIPVHAINKEQRKSLIQTLKDLQFSITGTMGMEWAIVADGGVVPEEVDFRDMTSRLFPNLYLIGDTLNINRPSGGFSLQLCWTTGWIAGTNAVKK